MAWSSLEVGLRQGGQLAVGVVLARMIAPAEFGLVAALLLFTGLAGVLAESGLGEALIQRRDPDRADESTVFWFNLAVATVLALLLVAASPWIAAFYGEPRLTALTWAMAFNLWLSAWLTVPLALLAKRLDFRPQAQAAAAATLAGGAVAIVLAANGAGAWALAAQALATTAINVVALWWLGRWRPASVFRWERLRVLFGFGGFVLLSSLLDTFATRLYTIVIGRLHSAYELGIYSRALGTRDLPQDLLGAVFSRVALPAFSSQAHDPEKLRAALRAALPASMAINLPVMLGMAASAPALMPTLFGPQWSEAVPVLQVLCLAGALWPAHVANLNALMALGRSDLLFRLELLKKGILVLLVLLASPAGILAIAWAVTASSLAAFFVNGHYTRKFLGYSPLAQLRDIAPSAAIAAAMAGAVLLAARALSGLPIPVQLLIEVLLGAAIYLGAVYALRLAVFPGRRRA